ncbi:uncharacterized protein LOC129599951 [Paramacrobiotus metropolitanus]|uniref:uncharacterized protein LOC129599951 n=1 Tax=Paramacrobiotus metropolitanus TaxID=2943436 RepID=UPI0024457475|nr:uncharacterized protein LOC129599951 [Paramacrobiotus metropolitanus]
MWYLPIGFSSQTAVICGRAAEVLRQISPAFKAFVSKIVGTMPRPPKSAPLSPKKMKWLVATRIDREDEFRRCTSKAKFWSKVFQEMQSVFKDALGNRTSENLKISYENAWKKYKAEKKRKNVTGESGEVKYYLFELFDKTYGDRDDIAFANNSVALGSGSASSALEDIGCEDGEMNLSDDDTPQDTPVGSPAGSAEKAKKAKKSEKRSAAGETVKLMTRSVAIMDDMRTSLTEMVKLERMKVELAKLKFERQYNVEVELGVEEVVAVLEEG